MGNKIGKEKIEGQIYLRWWEPGHNPKPLLINGVLEIYINGVTYYGKVIERIPIYDDHSHVAFRFGKEIFEALVEEIRIAG